MKRRTAGLSVLVVLLAGLAAAIVLERLRSGPGLPEGTRELVGLDGPVEVLWDSLGIPHVFAETPADAFRAQGWLHATHRLWQIEMFRRVATGRLAELLGEAALDSDRFLRSLGLNRAAERSETTLDPETRALLLAYVDGLNRAVEDWRGPLPPELLLLGERPGPFTLTDALALEKIMAWDLAEYGRTLDLLEAYRALGPVEWERVRPRDPSGGTTILGDAGPVEGAIARGATPAGIAPDLPDAALAEAARIPAVALNLLEAVNTVRASNSWVVGPSRSASGKPLLSNDMHLALNAPTLWYLVGLHAPGLDVVGMSLPGTPGVIAGHTGGVAWGFTNATLDDTDLFLERVDPADSTRYLTPDGSAPFETRVEEIQVRGRDEPERLVVRETRHGPVVTQVESRAGGELLALSWVALEASTTHRALMTMNRASTVAELLEGVREFTDPHQNVVFADTAGSWGYWMAGRIPRRRGGVPPLLPVPGWTGEYDWDGYLDFEDHPHSIAPEVGFIATANNRQSHSPVAERISDGAWAEPYRAERISELLAERSDHDAESMVGIQLDVLSTFVRRAKPIAAMSFRSAGLDSLAAVLDAWDGRATLESREATLFHTWLQSVRARQERRLYGDAGGYYPLSVVADGLIRGEIPAEQLAAAARDAAAGSGEAWGEAHRITLDHPLAAVPWLRRLFGFGRQAALPRAGGPFTVNVAEYSGSEPPFTVRRGPSQRHVADLADLDGTGGFVLPGGQSGYPGDVHFMDQWPRWTRGELVSLPLERARVEARTVSRLLLTPGG